MKHDITLDDVLEIETTRFKSYLEYKLKLITAEIMGEVFEPYRQTRQATRDEIETKVMAGLKRAREVTRDIPQLYAFVNSIEQVWRKSRDDLLLFEMDIAGMDKRDVNGVKQRLIAMGRKAMAHTAFSQDVDMTIN